MVVAKAAVEPVRGRTPIRVLAVIDWLEMGGAQQHLLTLATGLAGAGFRFTVATSADEPLAADYRQAGIPVVSLEQRTIKHRYSSTFTARLTELASCGQFDLIHSHLHSASVAAAFAAGVSGLPLVITHHSMNTWRTPQDVRLGHWADRRAAAVIAVASNVAANAERSGVRVRVIPNGVRTDGSPWSAAKVVEARAGLGVPRDTYLVGFVGRFSPDKNPLLFVEAAAAAARRCPSAHFLMLGDGPLRPAAEARAQALGLEGRIVFPGFRPNAAALLPVLDTLVLSSDSEGAPLIVLEAMAASRPVVATAVGDVPAQIVDGETGFVVAPGDAAGLAEAIAQLADVALRAQLGVAGRERVLERFSVATMLAQIAAVYREVLERRPPVPDGLARPGAAARAEQPSGRAARRTPR